MTSATLNGATTTFAYNGDGLRMLRPVGHRLVELVGGVVRQVVLVAV